MIYQARVKSCFQPILPLSTSQNDQLEVPQLEVLEPTGSRLVHQTSDRFESSNKPCVMLASLKAAGLGVTLKSADYVFLMDP